eukprot:Tbor_TRINITY_DN3525_c0_g1::TRINITY_DN3525_c0_g1_i1::g.2973::m.2973
MVSKTRKQRSIKGQKMAANGGVMPNVFPSPKKSIHEKKTRPKMKAKMKIRLGYESSDIYEGFEDQKGVNWQCPTCGVRCRTVGYCVDCATGRVRATAEEGTKKKDAGAVVSSKPVKKGQTATTGRKAVPSEAGKKKLKIKKK